VVHRQDLRGEEGEGGGEGIRGGEGGTEVKGASDAVLMSICNTKLRSHAGMCGMYAEC
jgi:hypothetical protein